MPADSSGLLAGFMNNPANAQALSLLGQATQPQGSAFLGAGSNGIPQPGMFLPQAQALHAGAGNSAPSPGVYDSLGGPIGLLDRVNSTPDHNVYQSYGKAHDRLLRFLPGFASFNGDTSGSGQTNYNVPTPGYGGTGAFTPGAGGGGGGPVGGGGGGPVGGGTGGTGGTQQPPHVTVPPPTSNGGGGNATNAGYIPGVNLPWGSVPSLGDPVNQYGGPTGRDLAHLWGEHVQGDDTIGYTGPMTNMSRERYAQYENDRANGITRDETTGKAYRNGVLVNE